MFDLGPQPIQVVTEMPELSAALWDLSANGELVTWSISDGGNGSYIGRTDWTTGVTTRYSLPDEVENRDWEAMVPGVSTAEGASSIWILDVGDNKAKRKDVQFYEIEIPALTLKRTIVGSYAAGPRNVEGALAATSSLGVPGAYLIEKTGSNRGARMAWVDLSPEAGSVQQLPDQAVLTGIPFSITDATWDSSGKGALFLTYFGIYACQEFSEGEGNCVTPGRPKRVWTGLLGQMETILTGAPDRAVIANEAGQFYEVTIDSRKSASN